MFFTVVFQYSHAVSQNTENVEKVDGQENSYYSIIDSFPNLKLERNYCGGKLEGYVIYHWKGDSLYRRYYEIDNIGEPQLYESYLDINNQFYEHGVFIEDYEGCSLQKQSYYFGKVHGESINEYPSGAKQCNAYFDGVLHGTTFITDSSGKMLFCENKCFGIKHGKHKAKRSNGSFCYGEKHGIWKYYEKGELVESILYDYGIIKKFLFYKEKEDIVVNGEFRSDITKELINNDSELYLARISLLKGKQFPDTVRIGSVKLYNLELSHKHIDYSYKEENVKKGRFSEEVINKLKQGKILVLLTGIKVKRSTPFFKRLWVDWETEKNIDLPNWEVEVERDSLQNITTAIARFGSKDSLIEHYTDYDTDGMIVSMKSYLYYKGKKLKHVEQTKYDSTGVIKRENYYMNKKHGKHMFINNNGERVTENYFEDMIDGVQMIWNKDGSVKQKKTYSLGIDISTKEWWTKL